MQHDKGKAFCLQPFDFALFNGNSETIGIGKVTDFNVIYKPSISPIINVLNLKEFKNSRFEVDHGFVYCAEGSVEINQQIINEKEAFFIKDSMITINTKELSKLILVRW